MKKLIIPFLTFLLVGCNDGNFDVPAFEFSDTVNSCGEYILYKTNSNKTEVLVVTLNPEHFGTALNETSIFKISSALKVTYRIFKEGIASDYFCQSIPPSTPTVLKELIADSGSVNITTTAIETNGNSTTYTYEIFLTDLLFTDESERVYFETLSIGTFTITN